MLRIFKLLIHYYQFVVTLFMAYAYYQLHVAGLRNDASEIKSIAKKEFLNRLTLANELNYTQKIDHLERKNCLFDLEDKKNIEILKNNIFIQDEDVKVRFYASIEQIYVADPMCSSLVLPKYKFNLLNLEEAGFADASYGRWSIGIISINPSIKKSLLLTKVLHHEMRHACAHELNIKLSYDFISHQSYPFFPPNFASYQKFKSMIDAGEKRLALRNQLETTILPIEQSAWIEKINELDNFSFDFFLELNSFRDFVKNSQTKFDDLSANVRLLEVEGNSDSALAKLRFRHINNYLSILYDFLVIDNLKAYNFAEHPDEWDAFFVSNFPREIRCAFFSELTDYNDALLFAALINAPIANTAINAYQKKYSVFNVNLLSIFAKQSIAQELSLKEKITENEEKLAIRIGKL